MSEAERRLSADLVESILVGAVGARRAAPQGAGASGWSGEQPMAFVLLRPAERGTRALAELAERAAERGAVDHA